MVFGRYLIYVAQNNKGRTIGCLPSLFTCLLVQLHPFRLLNTTKENQKQSKTNHLPFENKRARTHP